MEVLHKSRPPPLSDGFPERSEGECGHLKVLSTEWYPDDGDTEQDTEEKVRQADPDASDADPDHVHDNRQAAATVAVVDDLLPEWP